MIKARFSYLKLTVVVAVLAITLIGLNGLLSMTTIAKEKRTTPPREIGLTPQPRFSERAASVLVVEKDTTTPTLPSTDACEFGGVTITALNVNKGIVDDKVEVGWDFTMPQQLAPLGTCATLDHFEVRVHVIYTNNVAKDRTETASPLARNAVVRFSSLAFKPRNVGTVVTAHYKITAISSDRSAKDL